MSGHGEKLSRKQELAIAALLQCPTLAAAAKQAGIGEATLWRWLQRSEFEAAYRVARYASVEHAITQLQQGTGQAVDTLRTIMGDGEAPPSSRVAAAKTVLDLALKLRETEGLEERLTTLEATIERLVPTAKRRSP